MNPNRDFRGIWIPADLWLTKELTVGEKLMYVEIESLSRLGRGCFASNAHFADMFSISTSRVSEIISSLASKGFVTVDQKREGVRTVQRIIKIIPRYATSSENTKNPFGKGDEGSSENTQGKNTGLSNTEKEDKNPCHQQADDVPVDEIFEVYERVLPTKPRVRIRDDARRKAIRSLWRKDKKFQSVEFWERYFTVVRDSTFLMSQKTFAFDWLMKPANFKKVAEGNYDNA